MTLENLFFPLDSAGIAKLILNAHYSVCYAGPSIQIEAAKAMVEVAKSIGPDMLTLCIDFDERVMRMGYGDIDAVKCLREAKITINHVPGLRMGILIVDENGFTFTPTALYLEAEPGRQAAPNAMRLNRKQAAEALARLSPGTKIIAQAMASLPEERDRIAELPLEVEAEPVNEKKFETVESSLKEAPPAKFDVVRQVRVFEPYLQYVEMSLSGAAIQRNRLTIPANIQKLGGGKEIEGRLRTTFELIEKGGKLSSKKLEDDLNKIRKNFTPSLGNSHGRVILKAAKPHFENRLDDFRKKLEEHQKLVREKLDKHLEDSKNQIVDYYCPRVIEAPPDALLGQLTRNPPTAEDAKFWLTRELNRIFPSADSLVNKMQLEVRFKDVTFETLNKPDFLESIKKAFPSKDWDKAYDEFKAAGEARENV